MSKRTRALLALTLFMACLTVPVIAEQVIQASPGQPSEIIGYYYLSGPTMTESHFIAESVPDTFTLWIWLEPLENGLMCAEYKILLPENVTVISEVINAAIDEMTGSIGDHGVTFCFSQCRYDPVWTHRVTCEVADHERNFIYPDYYGGWGPNEGLDCLVPAGVGEIRAHGPFGINVPTAVYESSWGAIKAMYDR